MAWQVVEALSLTALLYNEHEAGAIGPRLAGQAIDTIGDPTVHPHEHAQRRRRLTKGPEEF